jgi:hypothetical protein
MPYGAYDGPDKPNKGKRGGACNRQLCQDEPANWFNRGSLSWYCTGCAWTLSTDSFNRRDAQELYGGWLCVEVPTDMVFVPGSRGYEEVLRQIDSTPRRSDRPRDMRD